VDMDQHSYLRAPFAQRIAHLNDNSGNPPVTVKLRRHWLIIVAPGKKQSDKYSDAIYYIHAVDPKQLAEDRKALF
jgi:hypothetical protein